MAAPAPLIPKGPFAKWKVPPRYEMRTLIGSGSYGSVCEALDTSSNTNVAIKRVGHLFDDLIDCKRILRELSIMARSVHGNIVRLIHIVEPVDYTKFDELYIVMELCDSDFKKLIKSDVTLHAEHINTLLYNLLVGLNYLHSAGVYHRDLKPANCFCNQDCSVKIGDFGLARAIDQESHNLGELPNTPRKDGDEGNQPTGPVVPSTIKAKRCMTQHVVTRWYRAPELILLQDNYTEAIDTWSVGCIYGELLQMLGSTHFEDRGPMFPGSTCFPLSPDSKHKHDYKHHTRGGRDQLGKIFDIIGTPSKEDLDFLDREDATRYLQCFTQRPGETIRKRYASVGENTIDILEKMLQFSPTKRLVVREALEHPLLTDYRNPANETRATQYIKLDFESEKDLNEARLKHFFGQEIRRFNGQQ